MANVVSDLQILHYRRVRKVQIAGSDRCGQLSAMLPFSKASHVCCMYIYFEKSLTD